MTVTLRYRRPAALVLWGTLMMLASLLCNAATVLISNPDGALAGSQIKDNSKLIGIIGDFVDLGPGEHEMQIAAPRNYALLIKLSVSNASLISILESRIEAGNCTPAFQTTWSPPRIVSNGKKPHKTKAAKAAAVSPVLYNLQVATPEFGAQAGTQRCLQPMMLGCTRTMAVVAVDSAPSGAEVWIDNERMSVRTNTILSVPFCPGREKTKDVLIRMPGRVTCKNEVPVESGVQTQVNCDLRAPP